MASVNVDKLSLKELLDLEGKIEKAIAVAREREHGELKQDLAAFAEKRGFSLKEIFGRGKGKVSVAKYANPDDRSQRHCHVNRKSAGQMAMAATVHAATAAWRHVSMA